MNTPCQIEKFLSNDWKLFIFTTWVYWFFLLDFVDDYPQCHNDSGTVTVVLWQLLYWVIDTVALLPDGGGWLTNWAWWLASLLFYCSVFLFGTNKTWFECHLSHWFPYPCSLYALSLPQILLSGVMQMARKCPTPMWYGIFYFLFLLVKKRIYIFASKSVIIDKSCYMSVTNIELSFSL